MPQPASTAFDAASLFRAGTPESAKPWTGRAPFAFDTGDNDPSAVPVEILAEMAARVIRREGESLGLYHLGGSPLGYRPLRTFLSRRLRTTRGLQADGEQILITSGSTQGLDLVNGLLLEPGDTVLVEAHTYSAALKRVQGMGVRVQPAPLDGEGLDVEALETTLGRLAAQGIRPKYIYTIPTIQNPTGSILSIGRRLRLLELARQYGVMIFEDECYAELTWTNHAPAALAALDPERVIHIGSLSKTLAPALRVGYLTAAPQVLHRLLALKRDGGVGALNQMVAAEFLLSSHDAHLARLRTDLRARCDHMIEAVKREFGVAADVETPQGGMFVWVRLDPSIDVRRLVEPARTEGVVFNPGPDWSVEPGVGTNLLRLCFASSSLEAIDEGIARLARTSRRVFGLPLRSDNQP